MRVHLSDPSATSDLREFLRARVGAIVDQSGRDELEVSLVGSYGVGPMREQIALEIGRWRFVSRRPGCRVEFD
jgi:hypothetical protein